MASFDQLELMEASDSDSDGDLRFVDQVRPDIEAVVTQAEALDEYDPKADTFVKILKDKSTRANNKALVFSTFRHTLRYLLQRTAGASLRVGLVHGDVSEDERADLRRRFALPGTDGDAIDVLLSSEVGCEGLDFQFCDFLVNYDLPWNPMRIEQRIGRVGSLRSEKRDRCDCEPGHAGHRRCGHLQSLSMADRRLSSRGGW